MNKMYAQLYHTNNEGNETAFFGSDSNLLPAYCAEWSMKLRKQNLIPYIWMHLALMVKSPYISL